MTSPGFCLEVWNNEVIQRWQTCKHAQRTTPHLLNIHYSPPHSSREGGNSHELDRAKPGWTEWTASFHVLCCCWFHMAHKCEIGEEITCERCDVPAAGPSLQVNTDQTWPIMCAVTQCLCSSRHKSGVNLLTGNILHLLIQIHYQRLCSVISTNNLYLIFSNLFQSEYLFLFLFIYFFFTHEAPANCVFT